MRPNFMCLATLVAAAGLTACSGGTSIPRPVINPTATPTPAATASPTPAATATPTPAATATPTPAATATPTSTPAPTAQPQVVHIGFNHTQSTDPTFGAIAYYTGTSGANDPATRVTVNAGSRLVFQSDSGQPPHTASGLGSSSFPASFDNTGGATQTGSTIDSGTSWSTGTLQPGGMSQVFTVGPAGDYYFGCFYHYGSGMRDVIVSQ